jgi:hypothetical protein
VKPVNQKPNRLDRLDLIMADQEALGMNEQTAEPVTPHAPSGLNDSGRRNRAQARHLLHYLTDEIRTGNGAAVAPSGDATSFTRKAGD